MVKIKKEKCLISPEDLVPSSSKFEILGVLNPAAVRMKDGRILLYVRIIEKLKKIKDVKYFYSPRFVGKNKFKIKIDKFSKKEITEYSDVAFVLKDKTKRMTFISHLRKVILDPSGLKVLSIDNVPSFFGLASDGELGIEDPRITKLGDIYVMTYVSLSRNENISTSLAISKDLMQWTRKGIIFEEQNKDIVLFPEKIKGEYCVLHRPEGNFEFSPPHIWIGFSKDLIYWGRKTSLNLSFPGDWDYGRNGAGPCPLKTKKGWLLIYHIAEKNKKKTHIYGASLALLDLKNPLKVKAKSKKVFLRPSKDYGKVPFEDKEVVFPTGIVEDGKDILIYSGEGDYVVYVRKVNLNEVLKSMKKF